MSAEVKMANYCADCGVVIGHSYQRCANCSVEHARRGVKAPEPFCCTDCAIGEPHKGEKPLANNCGVCGKAPVSTRSGVCVGCYESPLAPRARSVAERDGIWTREALDKAEAHAKMKFDFYRKVEDANRARSLADQSTSALPKQRPSWDDYFFDMANLVSTRATCPRASVGVVLVDGSHRVIATGYNGAPSGEPHCIDVGCDVFANHCQRARHGEESAVESAKSVIPFGGDMIDAKAPITAYVSAPLPVCTACSRVLRRAGVTEVKWRKS